jgi:predicted DNA-binding transcriptional regulator AlpA
MPAEAILPLMRPEAAPSESSATLPALPPEQVTAAIAGPFCGVGESTWWRLHAAAKVPRPNKLGGKTLWRVAELREWIVAGCPDRRTWDAMCKAQK